MLPEKGEYFLEGLTHPWLSTPTTPPPGPARTSLTFPQALDGIEVVEAKVQPRIDLRGDPQKPNGRVFEQQILLPLRGLEQLERR